MRSHDESLLELDLLPWLDVICSGSDRDSSVTAWEGGDEPWVLETTSVSDVQSFFTLCRGGRAHEGGLTTIDSVMASTSPSPSR